MISPLLIVEAARAYRDVPYLHQGRSRAGLDCVGLLIKVGHDVGLIPASWDYTHYERAQWPWVMLKEVRRWFVERRDGPYPGDLIVIRPSPRLQHSLHVGIFTGSGVIHASFLVQRVIEHRLTSEWVYRRRGLYGWLGAA
ncbi:MAG: C40 family peptidase [Burkholderiales bacterium]|nr:C40 family peptidase [Burkholderiales bacterium]